MNYINGYNKEKVMEQIRKYNNGKQAVKFYINGIISYSYLAADGNRCAIGCFIPDGHPALQNQLTVEKLLEKHPDLEQYMPVDDVVHFQNLHDSCQRDRNVHDVISSYLENNCD